MTPSPLGPCRKEVLGGITPKRRHSQLNFFEGALWAPLGPLGPGALAPATPLSRWAWVKLYQQGEETLRKVSHLFAPGS